MLCNLYKILLSKVKLSHCKDGFPTTPLTYPQIAVFISDLVARCGKETVTRWG